MSVRTGQGANGETIILAAFCHTCQQDSLPMRNGTCGWCDTQILAPERAKPKAKPPAPIRLPSRRRAGATLAPAHTDGGYAGGCRCHECKLAHARETVRRRRAA